VRVRYICHKARHVALAIGVTGVALLLLPILAAAGTRQTAAEGTSGAPALRWVLKRTAVNPAKEPSPAGSTVTTRAGAIDWQNSVPPQVAFTAAYPVPPATFAAGRRYEFPVTLTGKITGGKDTPGSRGFGVIMLLNDRWVDPVTGRSPGVRQECGSPTFNAPVVCSDPVTLKGKLGFIVPTPQRAGERFSFGVGALDCGRCYVRFEYRAAPPSAAGSPAWPAPPDALVSLESVSNGCGGGEAGAQGKFGDTSTFLDSNINPAAASYTVNFREACKLHDAGYSGAKVRDPLHARVVVDFLTWTKDQVDQKFLEDMILICERTIPASAATALANCKAIGGNITVGARSRYNFVQRAGRLFWRDRPNLRGQWTLEGDKVAPPWAITHTGRTVKIAWRGGAGHPSLRGEFRGTLISRDQDSIVRGFARITEDGETTAGGMSLEYDPGTVRADKLTVRGRATGTLER